MHIINTYSVQLIQFNLTLLMIVGYTLLL